MSETPDVVATATGSAEGQVGGGLRYGPLAPADVDRVHEAALAALEARGVPVAGVRALETLERAGARVDRAAGRVWLSPALVRGAVAKAPASFVLPGRTADRDARFGGGPGGLLAAMAAAPDLREACTLADALPEVAAIGLPTPRLAGLAEVVESTAKPVLACGALDARQAAVLVEAAAALRAAGRELPPLAIVVHSAQQTDLDPLLDCAAGGLACAWLTQPLLDAIGSVPAGGDAEAVSEGAIEVGPLPAATAATAFHAAALAACALQQLVAPGSAYAVPALPAAIELHAPGLGSGAAGATIFIAIAQLAAHVGLPATTGFPTGRSSTDEWSAAADGTFGLLAAALGGAALVAGAGHTEGGTVYSPGRLVLDAETWSNVAAVAAGIVVDDEAIALDTIAAVGIGGNALGQKHTRRHMKDVWRPRLFDRSTYEMWEREGRVAATERAAALAGELLAGHQTPPLDEEKRATLRRIIETAGL